LQSYFVGCCRKTGEKVTIKEFHLAYYPAEDTSIMTEVLFLTKLTHPGIPQFRELFITDTAVFLVTEYVDHQRLSHCISHLDITEVRRIFKQLVSIVQYCHEKKIIVRDLNPQNIMIKRLNSETGAGGSQFDVKIADLSLAIESGSMNPMPAISDHPLFDWSLVKYSSPEMVLSSPGYTMSTDTWSLGVLLYTMLAKGKCPFDHSLDHILIRDITQVNFDFDDEIWEEIPEKAKNLVESLIKLAPSERLTAKDIVKNHWVQIGA
jgi:calcium-dependent protein kinase